MANISAIKLPDGTTYNIKDSNSGYITGMTILSYGSSTWQNFIDAYNANKVVYCRASSNSNPASGSQTRLAFMAYVNNATTPTEVEFQYYRSVSSHTASQQGDQVYVYKLTSNGTWTVTIREASVKVVAGTGLGGTYSNGTMTLTGPTKVSDLTNDSGFITDYTETDPVFSASAAAGITSSDISNWNSKQAALVSGTNIKTINDTSLLGSGDITVGVDLFIVTFSYDQNDDLLCDKTSQQIYEAVEDGKTVVGMVLPDNDSSRGGYYYLDQCSKDEEENPTAYYAFFYSLTTMTSQWYGTNINNVEICVENSGVSVSYINTSFVPHSRKINNKALSADITLTASDVGAQETLVSGTNIKTVNGSSLLGSGNLLITQPVSITTTLTVAGWSSNAQTVTATGVTSSNTVIVAPTPSDMSDYTDAGIVCTAQGTNTLTFECDTTPSSAIDVNVVII